MIAGIVAIMPLIRGVIVFYSLSTGALPVPVKVLLTIMVGGDPDGALIRRAAPITRMPAVMSIYWIPITIHKGVAFPRAGWADDNGSGRRRCADVDSELNARA